MAASTSLGVSNHGAAREDGLEVDPFALDWVKLRQHLFKENANTLWVNPEAV